MTVATYSLQSANSTIWNTFSSLTVILKKIPEYAINFDDHIKQKLNHIEVVSFERPRGSLKTIRKNAFSNLKSKFLLSSTFIIGFIF